MDKKQNTWLKTEREIKVFQASFNLGVGAGLIVMPLLFLPLIIIIEARYNFPTATLICLAAYLILYVILILYWTRPALKTRKELYNGPQRK